MNFSTLANAKFGHADEATTMAGLAEIQADGGRRPSPSFRLTSTISPKKTKFGLYRWACVAQYPFLLFDLESASMSSQKSHNLLEIGSATC